MTTEINNNVVMNIGSSSQTPVPLDVMITRSSSQTLIPPIAAAPRTVPASHGEKLEKFNGQNFKI